MVEKSVQVKLVDGLIAKTAALFVQEANRYTADIYLEKDSKRVNAKSIMGLMSLSIRQGDRMTLLSEGADAKMALNDLATFVSKESI